MYVGLRDLIIVYTEKRKVVFVDVCYDSDPAYGRGGRFTEEGGGGGGLQWLGVIRAGDPPVSFAVLGFRSMKNRNMKPAMER